MDSDDLRVATDGVQEKSSSNHLTHSQTCLCNASDFMTFHRNNCFFLVFSHQLSTLGFYDTYFVVKLIYIALF